MNKNEIIQIQGMEYKEMTKQLLNKCALATLIPSKVSLIGIKPNLVAPVPELRQGVHRAHGTFSVYRFPFIIQCDWKSYKHTVLNFL